LHLLRKIIGDNEDAICEVLQLDMNKPKFEAYVGEIAMVISEIDYAIRRLRSWAKPKRAMTPLVHFPAKSCIHSEALRLVLIIGPWNYLFQLVMCPLVAALAAGNCSILKPSGVAPHTSDLILYRSFLFDMKLRYAPYGNKLPWVKKLLHYFG
jgi:aldehyde dehydrogenase (NAD+)